jgi:hypothetical protein
VDPRAMQQINAARAWYDAQAEAQLRWWNTAVAVNYDFRRKQVGALRADFFVMNLTPQFLVAIGATTDAKALYAAAQAHHIRVRRPRDSQQIIMQMATALGRLKYVGERKTVAQIQYNAVGECSNGRLLLVGMIFVKKPGCSGEVGKVTTAFFIRNQELRRMLNRGKLRLLP